MFACLLKSLDLAKYDSTQRRISTNDRKSLRIAANYYRLLWHNYLNFCLIVPVKNMVVPFVARREQPYILAFTNKQKFSA